MKLGAVNSRRDLLRRSAGVSMPTLPPAATFTVEPTVTLAPAEQRMLRFELGPNSADLKTVTLEIA